MKIEVLKDSDGDYWLPRANGDQVCLTREGDMGEVVSPDVLAVSGYGPFTSVTLQVAEVDNIADRCDDCLYDRHFCYACDDAVSHGHRHEED